MIYHTILVIWVIKTLFYSFYLYSCHLLISSASVRSLLFLSFIVPIFAWNVPLISLIFLTRSLVFPTLLYFSTSLHCSLKSLSSPCYSLELCIQLSISFPFSFAFHLSSFLSYFSGLLRQPLCLLAFFFSGMILVTAAKYLVMYI